LLTLRGTPTIYYGDEIGMEQAPIPPEQVRDPAELRQPGKGMGRDGCRTPMPWDSSEYAGFSVVDPWLPLGPDHRVCCVSMQRDEPSSMYRLYQDLIALRKRHLSLSIGSFQPLVCENNFLLFGREHDNDRLLIALNLGADAVAASASNYRGRVLLSSHCDRQAEAVHGDVDLRPHEGTIIELTSAA
jgi:alpha-glucosidase